MSVGGAPIDHFVLITVSSPSFVFYFRGIYLELVMEDGGRFCVITSHLVINTVNTNASRRIVVKTESGEKTDGLELDVFIHHSAITTLIH